MQPAVLFQQLFRTVLAHQVEYSFNEDDTSFTTMIPLQQDRLPQVIEFSKTISFAGEWAWSVERFARMIHPSTFLFRLDWRENQPVAVTLYCRFPSEPDAIEFQNAIGYARPFQWHGPPPDSIANALGLRGPRGIAFRATDKGHLRTAVYFRSEQHAGTTWTERLTTLLATCQYPPELVSPIETQLKALYQPGPVGVIGIDDGEAGIPTSLKFDPADVPLIAMLAWLRRIGVLAARIETLKQIAIGFRAESVTYAGVQFGLEGLSGWRLYLTCEPGHARNPGQFSFGTQRTLRPVRQLTQ